MLHCLGWRLPCTHAQGSGVLKCTGGVASGWQPLHGAVMFYEPQQLLFYGLCVSHIPHLDTPQPNRDLPGWHPVAGEWLTDMLQREADGSHNLALSSRLKQHLISVRVKTDPQTLCVLPSEIAGTSFSAAGENLLMREKPRLYTLSQLTVSLGG